MKRLPFILVLAIFLGCASSNKRQVVKYWYKNWPRYEKSVPAVPGYKQRGLASWYGKDFHGRKTASGEVYNMYAFTAAHKSIPLGTYVRVKNLKNGKTVVVKINDRGPYVPGRIIDLSYAAAKSLDMIKDGVVPVEITVLGNYPVRTVPRLKAGEYYVQVGAFTVKRNAERLASRIASMGYSVKVVPRYVRGVLFYRVLVGPYLYRSRAEKTAWLLKRYRFPARVVND